MNAGSREQTEGTTQINTAVSQLDRVTQSNAATAEESAAAAEELNAQAEVMKQSVAELLQLVGGNSKQDTAAPAISTQWVKPVSTPAPAFKRPSPTNGKGYHPESIGSREWPAESNSVG